MRHDLATIPFPTGVGAANSIRVEHFQEKTVQIDGTFVADIDIEGSVNGTTYHPLRTGISAPGIFLITEAVRNLRLRATGFTSSASGAAVLGAFHSRTDGG